MIPFEKEYYKKKIDDFNKNIKEQRINQFSIKYKKIVGNIKGYMYTYRDEIENIPILMEEKKQWMALSPLEIGGCYEAVRVAFGRVGVVGLGLGYFVQEILNKEDVNEVLVYEISSEVIDMYLKNFGNHEKLKIINGDAFKFQGEEFEFFFCDIYENHIDERAIEHCRAFNKKHKIQYYSFWGMEHFLLSLDAEDVVAAKVPDYWMGMAKNLAKRFYMSEGGLEKFEKLERDIVEKMLKTYKKI